MNFHYLFKNILVSFWEKFYFERPFQIQGSKEKMKSSCILLVIAVLLWLKCQAADPVCRREGQCWQGSVTASFASQGFEHCLQTCKNQTNCQWATLYHGQQCLLYSSCQYIDEDCTDCYSGNRECPLSSEDNCLMRGKACLGLNVTSFQADNVEQCYDGCKNNNQCSYYSFYDNECNLLKSCSMMIDVPGSKVGVRHCNWPSN